MSKDEIALEYIGKGYTLQIPARDLTADEVEQHGGKKAILEIVDPCTGRAMYQEPKQKTAAKKAGEVDENA